MKDSRPIGVFDSGVGGLTAVKELHRVLPEENIIYFGDIARVPYGTRSSQTIKRYAAEIIRYLAAHDVKAILAACGTVSANFTASDYAALGLSTPYLTVVEPAAREAATATRTGRIGVMATNASINSGAYTRAIQAVDSSIQVVGQPCPLLIPLVEQGMTEPGNPLTTLALELYLEPLRQAEVDTIVLGCTHFPLLVPLIREQVGEEIALVDSGAAAVRSMQELLGLECRGGSAGYTKYHVTDTVEQFSAVAKSFLKEDIREQTIYVNPELLDKGRKE